MPTVPKTPTDPTVLRAIVDLRRAGWSLGDVAAALRISRRTLERRLTEIKVRYAGKVAKSDAN